ncbi:hypothetical protein LTR95_013646 [Oleoguttula sp. CCFEE 5521]
MDRDDIALARADIELEEMELRLQEARTKAEQVDAQIIASIEKLLTSDLWAQFLEHETKFLYCVRHEHSMLSVDKEDENYETIIKVTEQAIGMAKAIHRIAKRAGQLIELCHYDPTKQHKIKTLAVGLMSAGGKIGKAMEEADEVVDSNPV